MSNSTAKTLAISDYSAWNALSRSSCQVILEEAYCFECNVQKRYYAIFLSPCNMYARDGVY